MALKLVDNSPNRCIIPIRLSNTGVIGMKRNRQVRFGTFKCQCGCGKDFTAEYITRAPQYLDRKHRNKKLAENKAAARAARTKELFKLYKARRSALKAAGVKSKRLIDFASVLPNPDYSLVFRDLTRHIPADVEARND